MEDDRRTRAELIAEIEELEKRVATLEASLESELHQDPSGARTEGSRLARMQRLLSHATDLICELAADGTLLYVSTNSSEILDAPADELIGRSILETGLVQNLHPEDRDALTRNMADLMREPTETERVHRLQVRGVWRSLACRSRSLRDPDGGVSAVIIARDVTDREAALDQLRQSEERYRRVIDATHELVTELDAEGRVVFISPSCLELLGVPAEEMVGTTPFSLLHPEDVEHLAELFLGRLESEEAAGDGAVFRTRHRDGSWRWLEGTGINFETAEGEPRVVAVARDVTARIEAESAQRRLLRRVEQARRFESLGMLATGVAHDFNNLLTPILGAAGLALMDLPADSPIRARLERIQRASSEAAALTNQLLEYAGMGGLDATPVELPAVIASVEEPLRAAVGEKAELRVERAADAPRIEADATQLGQLVSQLVDNAVDAIEAAGRSRGSVTLRTGAGALDAEAVARLAPGDDCQPGRYAWLEVEDDGDGMDETTRARAFDPFFTTK
ncbi:MAG: PAS domain S-box protein, partial [Myxococcota bacterium]